MAGKAVKAPAAKPALEAVPEPAPEATPQSDSEIPARLLIVELTDSQIVVHQQGVSDLEAPTTLRLAAQIVERKLGLRE